MPHEVKSFHWLHSDGWRSNEWDVTEQREVPDTLMDNLRGGWVFVATLNNGQKVRVKCRS